jgi:hypothetical protein
VVRRRFQAARPAFFEGVSVTAGAEVYDEAVLGRNNWEAASRTRRTPGR